MTTGGATRAAASLLARSAFRGGAASGAKSRTPMTATASAMRPPHPKSSYLRSFRDASSSSRPIATLSAGDALAEIAKSFPNMDAVRYEHKNVKWSFKHIDYHSDALANGLLDYGFVPGDRVLSWLPLHFCEQHILQFACSKAGLVLYHLDPAQAVTDPEGAKAALKTALEVTEANILVSQEAGSDVNYVRLCEDVIPEIRIFDFGDGMPFVTPRFPHLRVPVHTGFDVDEKRGMEPLKHLLCPAGTVKAMLGDLGTKIDGSTPLLGELTVGKDGLLAKGKVLSNDEVMKKKLWPVVTSMLQREYLEVGGVGVVW